MFYVLVREVSTESTAIVNHFKKTHPTNIKLENGSNVTIKKYSEYKFVYASLEVAKKNKI